MIKGFGLKDISKNSGSMRSSYEEKIKNVDSQMDNIVKIPLERCHTGNFQPRSHISDNQVEALMNSIEVEGQQSPIIVYINGVKKQDLKKNDYFIVAGHTRVEALKKLGRKDVNAIIYNNPNKAILASVTSNEMSNELHVVDKGTAMQSLLDCSAFRTQEDLAKFFRCEQSTISKYLSWNIIPKEVKSVIVELNIKSRSQLDAIRKKYKKFKDGKSHYEQIELLNFDVIESLREKVVANVEEKEPKSKSTITNFLYMKDDKFHIRDRSLKKLSLQEKKKLYSALETMANMLEN